MATVMYSVEKRSRRNTLDLLDLYLVSHRPPFRLIDIYSRRCKPVKRRHEQYEPEDGIDRLYWEFLGGEKQRKQRDVSGNCQWSECAQIPSILQSYQTERDDHQQYGFLVNVPAEQKRGVSTESQTTHKVIPSRSQEDLNQRGLLYVRAPYNTNKSKLHLPPEPQL